MNISTGSRMLSRKSVTSRESAPDLTFLDLGSRACVMCLDLEHQTYTVVIPIVWTVCACVFCVRSATFCHHQKKAKE